MKRSNTTDCKSVGISLRGFESLPPHQKFMTNQLNQLIAAAERIFITAHISPDPDAISSALLLYQTLRLNYPDKKIIAVLEEEPEGLSFLPGYKDLRFTRVLDATEEFAPDLFVLLDGNNFERCSRKEGTALRQYLKSVQAKVLIIDHHELTGKDEAELFINDQAPATVQNIFELCFGQLDLKQPKDAPQIALTGFYADTGGFVYIKEGQESRVFDFARELVTAGAKVEIVKNELENYSETDMEVISELSANLSHKDDYSFSYLSDEFIDGWLASGNSHQQLQRPTNLFLNNFIRNIEGRSWGFTVYKNTLEGENIYSVSLRSQAGVPDVSKLASDLGGGGHKPAAGARFESNSVKEAIQKVQSVIASSES